MGVGVLAAMMIITPLSPRGEISFWKFLRIGSVITVVDLGLAFGILALERAAGMFTLLGL